MTKSAKYWVFATALILVLGICVAVTGYALPKEGSNFASGRDISWYNPASSELTITTAEQLYDMAELSKIYDFRDQTIKLGADIVVNTGSAADWKIDPPARLWYPIRGFAGTFDGQGHTISGLYGVGFYDAMGLFSETTEDCTVKDLRVVNSYFKSIGSKGNGLISASGAGTFDGVYAEGRLFSGVYYCGGIIGNVNTDGSTVVTSCAVKADIEMFGDSGRKAGGITGAVTAENAVCTISHCLADISITSPANTNISRGTIMEMGGIVGITSAGTTTITDCLTDADMNVTCRVGVGSVVGYAAGGTVSLNTVVAVSKANNVAVGYTAEGCSTGSAAFKSASVCQGMDAISNTSLSFGENWLPVTGSLPMPKKLLSAQDTQSDTSWYVGHEQDSVYIISTPQQLRGLSEISVNNTFAGKTIKLGADIDYYDTWTPICSAASDDTKAFAGTFDGQGHTISGLYCARGAYGSAMFCAAKAGSVIKDFKLKDSIFKYTGSATYNQHTGSIVGWCFGGTISGVYSNAAVDGGTSLNVGGIVGTVRDGTTTVENCWFAGNVSSAHTKSGSVGGIIGAGQQSSPLATVVVSNCLFTGTASAKAYVGGIIGNATLMGSVSVSDCLSAGKIQTATLGRGSVIGQNNSATISKVYATADCCSYSVQDANPATVTKLASSALYGDLAMSATQLDFVNYWVSVAGGIPELNSLSAHGGTLIAADTSWYVGHESDTEYTLTTAEQLLGFAQLSQSNNFSGKTVKLDADITVNEGTAADLEANSPRNRWTPIGTFNCPFSGTFDGQGHTVSGIYGYATETNAGPGLFNATSYATIRNFRLVNSYFEVKAASASSWSYTGAIAGFSNGSTFTDIYCDAIVKGNCGQLGGIVGRVNEHKTTLTNCVFAGSITATVSNCTNVGGIAANNQNGGYMELNHCGFTGSITSPAANVGGLIGNINTSTSTPCVLNGCMVTGTVNSSVSTRGLLCGHADVAPTVTDCFGTPDANNTPTGANTTALMLPQSTRNAMEAYFLSGASLDFTPFADRSAAAFEISTAGQFNAFSVVSRIYDFAGKTVTLTQNITENTSDAAQWGTTPPAIMHQTIGTQKFPFAGTFDGGNHTVSGLYCKTKDTGATGMFGSVRNAVIQNVTLVNSYFTSDYQTSDANATDGTGSIAGSGSNSDFIGINSSAFVHSVSGQTGGIVGKLSGACTVENCLFNGSVDSASGGIGGIVGRIRDNGTTALSDCAFMGTLQTSGTQAGGIVGRNNADGTTLSGCMSTGSVSAAGTSGVLVGSDTSDLTATDCYGVANGATAVCGNRDDIAAVLLGTNLRTAVEAAYTSGTPVDYSVFADMSDSVFEIETAAQLNAFSVVTQANTFSGKTVKLTADITLNEGSASDWATTAPEYVWVPIGSDSAAFAGTFDGNGHTVSGIYCAKSTMTVGFFGRTNDTTLPTIKNFKLTNSYFKYTGPNNWQQHVGGVVAWFWGGTISGVYTDAIVDGGACQDVGGFVGTAVGKSGSAATDTISNCWFDGTVTGYQNIGGIVGGPHQSNGQTLKIEHCLFTGNATGNSVVGGIIGASNGFASAQITDTLSAGTVSASSYFGSIVASKEWSGAKTVCTNVYATNECCEYVIRPDQSLTGVTKLAQANILGDLAKTNTALNFTDYWVAIPSRIPGLLTLTDEKDIPLVADISWYSASQSEFTITTAAQLKGFSELSKTSNFSGKTVKLGADIVYNEGSAADWATEAPINIWTPICTNVSSATNGFAGTFDGQGHTVSGLYALRSSYGNGMFSGTTAAAVIKDFKLVNSYFKYTGTGLDGSGKALPIHTAGIVGWSFGGSVSGVYCDAIIDGGTNATGIGGIVGTVRNNELTISNCWFAGSVTGGSSIGGIVANEVNVACALTVEHCLFTGSASGSATVGGIIGLSGNFSSASVSDCLSAGTVEGTSSGSVIGAKEWSGSKTVATNVYATNECFATVIHPSQSLPGATKVAEADITGSAAYVNAPNLDYDNYWVVPVNGTPELKDLTEATAFAERPRYADTSWYVGHESNTTFTITTASQLKGLAELAKTNTFTGKTIKLGADIVYNEGDASAWGTAAPANVWTPIGVEANRFKGTFDGQGHTVSGLYYKTSGTEGVGFFCCTDSAVIKNLNLTNSYFESTANVGWNSIYGNGSVAGYCYGTTFTNVYSDCSVIAQNASTGGFVGSVRDSKSTFNSCWFTGSVNMTVAAHGTGVGGFVGITRNSGYAEFNYCGFNGTVTSVTTQVGGFVGRSDVNTTAFNNCISAGTLSGTSMVGWLVGRNTATTNSSTVNCVAIPGKGATAAVASTPGSATAKSIPMSATTQLDFSPFYDYSGKTEFLVGTAAQLNAFTVVSDVYDFANKTVKLTGDITLNTGDVADFATQAPTNTWTPVRTTGTGAENAFAGTFDGQGHTISGLYCTTGTTAYAIGMFGVSKGTIRNFRLANSYIKTSGTHSGGIVGWSFGGLIEGVYTNATVDGSGQNNIGGIIGSSRGTSQTVRDCWFAGTVYGSSNVGGIVGGCPTNDSTALTVENCLFTGAVIAPSGGGLVGNTNIFGSATVSGCVSAGTVSGTSAGSVIGARAPSTVVRNVYATEECCGNVINGSATTSGVTRTPQANLMGRVEAYFFASGLDFVNYWVARDNRVPGLRTFTTDIPDLPDVDVSWYNDTDTTFEITTPAQLMGFSYLSMSDTFAGKTVKLGADIVFNTGSALTWASTKPANIWVPVSSTAGNEATAFAGTFDGQGHTISGLYSVRGTTGVGLFRAAAHTSVIRDFRLENSYFACSVIVDTQGHSGSVVGWSFGGTIQDIYSNAIVNGGVTSRVGGIVGTARSGNLTISDCWFDGVLRGTRSMAYCGGMIGGGAGMAYASPVVTVQHCLFTGLIDSSRALGGIIGGGEYFTMVNITDCLSNGTIRGLEDMDAVMSVTNEDGTVNITNVYTTGSTSIGNVSILSAQDLTGAAAYRNASGLDYENYFLAQNGKTPVLKRFCDGTPAGMDWTDAQDLPTSGSYVLQTNVTVQNTVEITDDLVVDMNGHTITTPDGKDAYRLCDDATLTVTDTSANGNGTVGGIDIADAENAQIILSGGNVASITYGEDAVADPEQKLPNVIADGYTGTPIAIINSRGTVLSSQVSGSDLKLVGGFTAVDDAGETAINDLSEAESYEYVVLNFNMDLVLPDDMTIDLNNFRATVNNDDYELSVLDSNADNYGQVTSAVTVTQPDNLARIAARPGSADQYALLENADGSYTPHWLYVKLTTATLRTAKDSVGIYYKSAIKMDEILKEHMTTYGIAASLNTIPADFRNEPGVGYTRQEFAAEDGNVDMTVNSGIVEKILEKGRTTPPLDECGKMPIYAVAYVTVEIDGTEFTVRSTAAVGKSLYELMTSLNSKYTPGSAPDMIKQFVANWSDPMKNWNLTNLGA